MGTIIQKLNKVKETKEAIRQAIAGKGQSLAVTDPFSAYPEKIRAIETGVQLPELTNPGTAANLLAGKQLVDQYGKALTGTMPQKSASDLTASGASVTVPAGYYPSQVSKSVATAAHPKPTISRSGGTITAKHVQSAGYTSGGTATETLTLTTQEGKTVTPGTSLQTAVASGRLTTGTVYVAGDTNLKAENIKSGVSIFGVDGTLYSGGSIYRAAVSAQSQNPNAVFSFTGLSFSPLAVFLFDKTDSDTILPSDRDWTMFAYAEKSTGEKFVGFFNQDFGIHTRPYGIAADFSSNKVVITLGGYGGGFYGPVECVVIG